jgi:hypothetical protein
VGKEKGRQKVGLEGNRARPLEAEDMALLLRTESRLL